MGDNIRRVPTLPELELKDEWRCCWLDDVMDFQGGAQPPANEFYDSPAVNRVRFIQIRDFDTDSHLTYIDDSPKWRKCEAEDVLIARYGASLGRILRGLAGAYNVALVKVLPKEGIERKFLYYLLKSRFFQTPLTGVGARSAQSGFNKADFGTIPVPVPPLREQQAIACILGALDDKIELNRRRNATLEALARALFRSWFVDFDPVRAKVEGRAPVGMSAAVAALFPAALEDSTLGPIPKGWRVGTVGESFRLTMGQSPPGETYNETGEGLPFYQGRTDFGFRFPTRRVYCTQPTRFAEPGDTLVSVRAPVGDINLASERCAVGRGVAAVRHLSGSRSFTYHALESLQPLFRNFEAEGTVFGSINKTEFEKLRIVLCGDDLLAAFERLVAPLDDMVECSEGESRTLAALRDALLPKLISGELRVQDAERIVGRAV
jgi:type I restriction enzyme S subunit